jgi:hypothetical protein
VSQRARDNGGRARGGARGGFGPSACLWAAAAEAGELIEMRGRNEDEYIWQIRLKLLDGARGGALREEARRGEIEWSSSLGWVLQGP